MQRATLIGAVVGRVVCCVVCCAGACQGGGTPAPAPGSNLVPVADARRTSGFGSAAVGSDPGSADPGSDDATPPRHPEEPETPDSPGSNAAVIEPGKLIVELGAVPAWQGVVDRYKYLARRGEHGVVYGVTGGPVMVPAPPPAVGSGSGSAVAAGSGALVASPYTWLVDDTDGDGALAIRCAFGSAAAPKPGARIAVGGAWALDDDRRWLWRVDAVTALPAAGSGAAPTVAVQPSGHVIATINGLPFGAHMISVAKEGELAYFQVVGYPPAVDGEGWPVADDIGNPVYALLNLPGERATYGAQDMRAPEERWVLKRGVTYVTRLRSIHKHGDKPATLNARSGVVRLR
jgi:hypothetical protein